MSSDAKYLTLIQLLFRVKWAEKWTKTDWMYRKLVFSLSRKRIEIIECFDE